MKLVTFGDLHSHMFTDFSEPDEITGNSRFTQTIGALDFMLDYCLKKRIGYVLFAGDMFHKRKAVDTTTFNLTLEAIKRFGQNNITVIMIPGNHDQVDNTDFPEHSLKAFGELEGVILLDRFTPHWINDSEEVLICPVPYSKNAEMVKEAIEKYAYHTVNEGLEKKAILLGHLGLSGAFVGKSSYAMADAFTVEDLFPHAFRFGVFGHFHKRQDLGGHNHFFYTGAPTQHNFNDEGQDKGFTVIDMESGEKEFVEIPSSKFITVEVDKDTDMEKLKEELKGNFVRFQVNAENADQLLEAIPEETKFRLEIQKDYEEDKRLDVDISMSFEDSVRAYAKEFDPEAEEIGLEILGEVL